MDIDALSHSLSYMIKFCKNQTSMVYVNIAIYIKHTYLKEQIA